MVFDAAREQCNDGTLVIIVTELSIIYEFGHTGGSRKGVEVAILFFIKTKMVDFQLTVTSLENVINVDVLFTYV